MSQAAFRLVETMEMPASLRFERRTEPRRRITGSATIICTREDEDGECRRKITSVLLHDIAEHGLGAISREPLPVGAALELMMPSHGVDMGFDLFGRIVRCEPCEEGYSLGIMLYQAASAVA